MTEGYNAGGINVVSSLQDKMPLHIRTVQTQNAYAYDRRASSSANGMANFRAVKLRGEQLSMPRESLMYQHLKAEN